MTIPQTVNIRDRSIKVYLGGPGFGEGVFIVIGQTLGLGIDCCSSFIQRRLGEDSFIERRIREFPPGGSLVWILTHYHYDHYHCLSSLLKLLGGSIKATVFPFDYNPADMSYLAEQMSEFPDSPTKVHRAQREYDELRTLLKLKPFNHSVSRVQGTQLWLSNDLILPDNDRIPLTVRVCSVPSDVYDDQIGTSAVELRDHGTTTSRRDANRGSYIIHCRLGAFEGLFLGDAGTERLEQLVATELIGDVAVDCLKVGHHGSLDATNEQLLKLCKTPPGHSKEQHALIAPYKATGLPNNEVIAMLKAFGYNVHLAGVAGQHPELKERIAEEGSMLTNIDVSEAIAAGSDIISVNFDF